MIDKESLIKECTNELNYALIFEFTAVRLCNEEGWFRTKYHQDDAEVEQWLKQYCQDPYMAYEGRVIFKSDKDFAMFLLRWA